MGLPGALAGLTNVARHAQAATCRIRFAVVNADSRPALSVEIYDDGVGLPADQRAGVGLTSMRERTARPFADFTDREREVLELIAQGHNNPAIAERLVLSVKTVRNHVSNILSKLQSIDRAQTIVRTRDTGFGKGGNGPRI
jgi:DNA-binding NarL/FixJ family response regulator